MVSGAPVKVETDASVVAEAREPLDHPGDLVGAGDCSAGPEVEDDGLAGWLTVAVFSFESMSSNFFPATL